ncbi:hypothetical protein GUITHDRAFT_155721 [Guillardia theta CCMP2712]|uniref:Uncharacterized protein n=1 Tax=Guillardia theta (strain CCMP2712) TaxID=905079 RepID=L1IE02_GUITC|nr:hypothetical protein GUITHDRAFT_155721 [Guillardia theta CCMP2712]EKX34501.1 hypothetical protein GUITHDRAFT_155721 [Guillardia theta CCMP2712]|eukprot:XP_005821481.1 hypothetical protein GUITHDRAFT_155721 [Guillardia theta CCMP2712]
MSSPFPSSHDWYNLDLPLYAFLSNLSVDPSLHSAITSIARDHLLLLAAAFLPLAHVIALAVRWLLEDEDDHDLWGRNIVAPAVVSERQEAAALGGAGTGGFDRRKMLEPCFGQTFKVKRMGIYYSD